MLRLSFRHWIGFYLKYLPHLPLSQSSFPSFSSLPFLPSYNQILIKSVKMGYSEIDKKAINTIRVLAVSPLLYFPYLLRTRALGSSLNWFLPRHGCPAISCHEGSDERRATQ